MAEQLRKLRYYLRYYLRHPWRLYGHWKDRGIVIEGDQLTPEE
jgi:hypothetical protein